MKNVFNFRSCSQWKLMRKFVCSLSKYFQFQLLLCCCWNLISHSFCCVDYSARCYCVVDDYSDDDVGNVVKKLKFFIQKIAQWLFHFPQLFCFKCWNEKKKEGKFLKWKNLARELIMYTIPLLTQHTLVAWVPFKSSDKDEKLGISFRSIISDTRRASFLFFMRSFSSSYECVPCELRE